VLPQIWSFVDGTVPQPDLQAVICSTPLVPVGRDGGISDQAAGMGSDVAQRDRVERLRRDAPAADDQCAQVAG
jgi:hypothetical protein